ncbi:MAG: hypothetical protein ACOYXA_14005 [Bacteroidota bacterium]
MKQRINSAIFTAVLLILVHCKEEPIENPIIVPDPEEEIEKKYPVSTIKVKDIASTSFMIEMLMTEKGNQKANGVYIQYHTNSNFEGVEKRLISSAIYSSEDKFKWRVNSAQDNSPYYVRSLIEFADTTIISNPIEIKTFPKRTIFQLESNQSIQQIFQYKLGFSANQKGYILHHYNYNELYLAEYNPSSGAWTNSTITNTSNFFLAHNTNSDMASFVINDKPYIGLGHSSSVNKSIFAIDLYSPALQQFEGFDGINSRNDSSIPQTDIITIDDQAFGFIVVRDTSEFIRKLAVFEFDINEKKWSLLVQLPNDIYSILMSFYENQKIFIVTRIDPYTNKEKVFEFDLSTNQLSYREDIGEAKLVEDTRVKTHYDINNSHFYISLDNNNSNYLNSIDLSTFVSTRIATYPEEVKWPCIPFRIGNIIYTICENGSFFGVEI